MMISFLFGSPDLAAGKKNMSPFSCKFEICAGFLPAGKVEKMAGVKWQGRGRWPQITRQGFFALESTILSFS